MKIFLAVSLAFLFLVAPAFADATIAVPPSANTTVITLPVGDWVAQVVPVLGELIAIGISGAVLILLKRLPEWFSSKITKDQVDQVDKLLIHAADFGLNTVAADVKGKTISADTGNAVAATALQYVIDHGPDKVIAYMGGAEAVKEKIIARLPISGAASVSNPPGPAAVIVAPIAGDKP